MCLFLGGVWGALKSTSWAYGQATPLVKWLSFILILAMMSAFALPFLWSGFGPGGRNFQISTSIGPVTTTGLNNESAGKTLFSRIGIVAGLVVRI
jgi:hypothetical protein